MASPVHGASLFRSGFLASLAAAVAAAASVACAAPAAQTAVPATSAIRILVKLVEPSDDASAIAARASREAGVPVFYAASVSSSWHSLSVRCSDAASCDAAIDRLRQSGVYSAIELDGRKRSAAN
jgi:hypothetical protein